MPHGSVEVPLAVLLVFASAKLLSELFERMGQPGIVGEILAGVLIGPHVLGWMSPNEVLRILADLGVMFLLFRVGLEIKAGELVQVGGTALMVALGGVFLPFLAGWGICTLWGQSSIESIFTGAAMVATSVGITGEVLAARGLLSTQAARIILAAAVVDDILGLLVLAVVSGMAQGSVNYLDIALTGTIALGFTAFVAKYGSRTAQRVMPHVGSRMRLAEGEFALAMTLLFGLAVLAVYAGWPRSSARSWPAWRSPKPPRIAFASSPTGWPNCWCRSSWSTSGSSSIPRPLPAAARSRSPESFW